MRKISLLVAAFLFIAFTVTAQCDTKTKWVSSKTEFIKASGDVQTKPESVTVTTDKENILVDIGNGEDKLQGKITDLTCNWQDSANGNMSFKSEVTDKSGDVRHAAFTIEAKNGKVTILLEAKEEETKIRLTIDSYEAVK